MATNKTSKSVSKSVELVRGILANPDQLGYLMANIPEDFVAQLEVGKPKLELDASLVSDVNYNLESSQYSPSNFYRIEFCEAYYEEPKKEEDPQEVRFKLRLVGLMNYNTGEMQVMKSSNAGQANPPGVAWLAGFRSLTMKLTSEHAEAGLITPEHFEALVAYAEHYQAVIRKEGSKAFFGKARSREKIWLTASNPNFLFQFNLEIRTNPQDLSYALGIGDIEWRDAQLFGYGIGQQAIEPGFASEQVRGAKVKLGAIVRPTIVETETVSNEGTNVSAGAAALRNKFNTRSTSA